MLRKRSRPAVIMSDHHHPPIPSPSPKSSSLFAASPRLFVAGFSDYVAAAAVVSPASILETKPFMPNHFLPDTKNPRNPPAHRPWHNNGDSRAVGLGAIVSQPDHHHHPIKSCCNPAEITSSSRMVVFGSQLKIHIPNSIATADSPLSSPIEFGVKNKSTKLALLSPVPRSPMGGGGGGGGCLSAREMEMSEDYTRVIAHGPNPKTTHIFDDCIVESCGGEAGFVPWRRERRWSGDFPSDDFLAFCHACKKSLGPGKDIFMYRGDKAFCSSECRYEEILSDEEGMEKSTTTTTTT